MKVKELIQILQDLDPELDVLVTGYEGGFHFATFNGQVEEFAKDYHTEWYYGPHEKLDQVDDRKQIKEIIKGVVL